MTKAEALSKQMQDVLDVATKHGGILERWPGGYWSYPGVKTKFGSPNWWTGTSTIHALVTRGRLEYTQHRVRSRRTAGGTFPVQAKVKEPAAC